MKETDIRPEALMQRYLELTKSDAISCFGSDLREPIPCVACESSDVSSAFEKHGFSYGLCQDCGTLYQTPRPTLSSFEFFYRESVSSKYFAETFAPAVEEARRERVFQPRVERLANMCANLGLDVQRLIDVGAGYGNFLNECRKRFPDTNMVAVEPSVALAIECRSKGFEVVESFVEQVGTDYEGFADLVVSFEVLEHVHEPVAFMKSLKRLARPGGMVLVTTLCIDGFDLQTCWDEADQISPPHHINFFSVLGFKKLFKRVGLFDINVSTPGKLDVDIVRNAFHKNPNILQGQNFLKHIIRDEQAASAFQIFLTENCLSSHAWVIGKLPNEN